MKVLSMRGKLVDMAALMASNPTAIALGNARMNARGDVLGRNGQIVQPRQALPAAYATSSKSVRQVPLRNIATDFASPAEAIAKLSQQAPANEKANATVA